MGAHGRLVDLGINPSYDPQKVYTFIIKSLTGELFELTHDQIQTLSVRSVQCRLTRAEIQPHSPSPGIMQIKKDILDQQIIDTNQRRVVRVNDVEFDIRPMDGHVDLRILSVEVGWGAGIRRLMQGTMAKYLLRRLSQRFPPQSIPWEFVNLIESDPARRVKLRISYDRVGELHPADIADILEDLSRDEQKAVIESLDEETAAQALSEIPTQMQAALLETFTPEKAANIVEEMAPDEAADVLQEMPPEASAEVLADMGMEIHLARLALAPASRLLGQIAGPASALASRSGLARHARRQGPILPQHRLWRRAAPSCCQESSDGGCASIPTPDADSAVVGGR